MMRDPIGSGARYARRAVFAGLRASGGLRAIGASGWRRRRLLILCYHGVSLQDEHVWDPELFVTPEFLRRRFEILREGGYIVLPLEQATRSLREGKLPPRSVVLTFDDGFHNFIARAVPLLEEFGYPATNYVSSYYCVHQRPILQLALRYLLWRARFAKISPDLIVDSHDNADLGEPRDRARLHATLYAKARLLSSDREAQLRWIRGLAAQLGVEWSEIVDSRMFHLMTPEEVRSVAMRGFDVQLHTHRHRTPRTQQEFAQEILTNRATLENLTDRSAKHFCYPSGDVDPKFLPWLRGLGVETATTGVSDLAQAGDDPLLLPRYVDTMMQSEAVFEGWLSGAGALLSRKRVSR